MSFYNWVSLVSIFKYPPFCVLILVHINWRFFSFVLKLCLGYSLLVLQHILLVLLEWEFLIKCFRFINILIINSPASAWAWALTIASSIYNTKSTAKIFKIIIFMILLLITRDYELTLIEFGTQMMIISTKNQTNYHSGHLFKYHFL